VSLDAHGAGSAFVSRAILIVASRTQPFIRPGCRLGEGWPGDSYGSRGAIARWRDDGARMLTSALFHGWPRRCNGAARICPALAASRGCRPMQAESRELRRWLRNHQHRRRATNGAGISKHLRPPFSCSHRDLGQETTLTKARFRPRRANETTHQPILPLSSCMASPARSTTPIYTGLRVSLILRLRHGDIFTTPSVPSECPSAFPFSLLAADPCAPGDLARRPPYHRPVALRNQMPRHCTYLWLRTQLDLFPAPAAANVK